MTTLEVTKLLMLINGFDPRMQANEVRVAAWQSLLADFCPDMPYAFAERFVKKFYAQSHEVLYPDAIVTAWREAKALSYESEMPALEMESKEMPDWFKQQMKNIGVIPHE